uniref:reticulon-1-like isoform X5 n=2 Tax=Myxine glutinosa TaxID=7769 RepID=UPI00358E92D2
MEGDPDKVWEPQSGHHIGSSAHQMTPQQIIGTSSSEEEDEEPDIYTAAPVESQKAEAKYPDHPTVPTRQLPYVVDSDSDTEEVYGSTMLEHIPPDLLEEMNKMAKGIQRSSEGSPLKAVDEKCEMEERGSGKKEFEKEMDVSKKQEEDDETDDEDEEVKERDEQLLEIIKMAKDPPGRLPSPHVQGADEMYEPEIQWADVSSTEWAQPGLVERTFLQPTAPQMPDRVEVEGQEDFEDVTSSAKEEPKMPKYVEDLLYWRDPRRSGAVFAGLLSLLLALTQYSVVSVFSYLALAMLALTITYRIYKAILKSIQKSDSGHPFKAYLDKDISVTQEGAKRITDAALPYVNHTTCSLQRLILVQDLVDSLKLAVCAWLTTYVGAIFNGLTLIILAVICLFSVPVIYEKYQAQIDQYVGLVRKQFDDVMAKVQAKIPGGKRKAE